MGLLNHYFGSHPSELLYRVFSLIRLLNEIQLKLSIGNYSRKSQLSFIVNWCSILGCFINNHDCDDYYIIHLIRMNNST